MGQVHPASAQTLNPPSPVHGDPAGGELQRLNRELRAISTCNQILMRAVDEQALLDEVCRIICEEAGYRMAWVGYAEADAARSIRPAAWAGFDAGYIARARLSWAETEHGRGPTGVAIRTGRTICIQDLEDSPQFAPWLESAQARAYRASIALPLKDEGGRAFGALNIYAGEPGVFTAGEQRLLEELAGDLAFGIGVLRARRERDRAEEDLAVREREYRALAENSPDDIFRYDREGRLLYANHHAASAGPSGNGWTGLEAYREALLRVIATGEAAEAEFEVDDGAGARRTHSVRFAPERDAEGRILGALAFGREITAKKRLMEQLGQSQKMEAVGQLAGGVAHDFNNILTAIIGFAHLLRLKTEPGDPQLPMIDQILGASDRAAQLTRSLLAFSRKQILRPEPIDLNALIANLGKLLGRLIGEDIELSARLAEAPLIVMADAGQIEQVLMNLVTNARDAMPRGGTLIIATESRSIGPDFARLHGYGRPGRYALITVSDSGTGMGEAVRRRLFEPFFTTKEKGKGTGLGLSMAYGIVKQHEGYINAYSEPGQGTTFRIYLPQASIGAAEEARAEAAQAPPRGTETILVAEDDPAVRGLTRAILEDSGYRVLEAADGAEALAAFSAHAGSIGLLLLDVVMPKMCGKEVQEAVRRLDPRAKVLFTSGYAAEFVERKGVLDEGTAFVAKPVSPHDLLCRIREVLDARA